MASLRLRHSPVTIGFCMTNLPASMTAIEISKPGGPDVLRACTRPVPVPGEGEVLIKVAVAGVNRPDVAQRSGGYPPPPGASDIPGLEVAGTIVATGPGVTGWKTGDQTTALVSGGGYAEYCAAPAPQCLPIPKGYDLVQAAAIPENWFTVWSNLVDRAHLKAGEKLLVHGGASGIGTAAIQLAKSLGVRVFATAGTDEKCRFCESLGAERAINYKTADFVTELKGPAKKDNVDVILDMVAGSYTNRNVVLLAPEGRLVIIALLGGSESQVNMAPIMLKRLTVTGSTLRARSVPFKADIARALLQHVWPLFEAGKAKPIIDSVFPAAEAIKAHERIDAADHVGKIMLKF